MKPDIGLKLFTEGIRSNIGDGVGFQPNPQIDMDVDAVIRFLQDVQQTAPKRQDGKLELTFEQKYLLKICEIQNTPERYFTKLGCSLVDALYAVHPKRNKIWDRKDRKFIVELTHINSNC